LAKLQEDPEFAEESAELSEMVQQVEAVLVKKAEGRPVTPEEYKLLSVFVNQVETGAEDRRQAEIDARRAEEAKIRETIPVTAFDIPLEDLGISPRIAMLITGEGFSAIGDLMMQLAIDADVILALNGIGPKAMEDIQETIKGFEFPEPVVVEETPVEEEVEEVPAAEGETPDVSEDEEAVDSEAKTEVGDEAVEDVKDAEDEEETDPETISMEEALEVVPESSERDEDREALAKLEADQKKKQSKKKAYRQIEYDPDHDVTIVKRHRKGEEEDWEEFLD
jgi:N utilization substance protein A